MHVEEMPSAEFAALWQRYIAAFAELLLQQYKAPSPESPAIQLLVIYHLV